MLDHILLAAILVCSLYLVRRANDSREHDRAFGDRLSNLRYDTKEIKESIVQMDRRIGYKR